MLRIPGVLPARTPGILGGRMRIRRLAAPDLRGSFTTGFSAGTSDGSSAGFSPVLTDAVTLDAVTAIDSIACRFTASGNCRCLPYHQSLSG